LGGAGDPPFLLVDPTTKIHSRYCPLPFDEPGGESSPLFERFANLQPTKDAIRQFAGQQGWLGIGTPVILDGNGQVDIGEPLERWAREIHDLQHARVLWRWLEEKDQRVQVEWKSKDCIIVRVHRASQRGEGRPRLARVILLHRRHHEALFRSLKRDDETRPVRTALLLLVNEKLSGSASPCLLLDRHGALQGFVRPHNLLAALWVQLYQAIQGQRRVRWCVYCGELMDVTGSRGNKKAHARCVHNAKMARYRRKRTLQASGKKKTTPMTRREKGSASRTR
jgi:hypothetical protein